MMNDKELRTVQKVGRTWRYDIRNIVGNVPGAQKSGFQTKQQAEFEANKALIKFEKKGFNPTYSITFFELCNQYKTSRIYASKTQNNYKKMQIKYCDEFCRLSTYIVGNNKLKQLGNAVCSEIDANLIQEQLIKHLYNTHHRNSAGKRWGLFKKILNYAVQINVYEVSPALACKPLYQGKIERKDHRRLTANDVQKLIDNAVDLQTQTMIVVASTTGMRPQEIFALQKTDISWNEAVININRAKDKEGKISLTKTQNGKRTVPLVDKTAKQLRLYLDDVEKRGSWEQKNSLFVFANRDGNTIDRHNFNRRKFRQTREKAKLDDQIVFRLLRHFYAATIIAAKLPTQKVTYLMGHESIKTTEKHYSYELNLPSRDTHAYDLINNAFGGVAK